MINTFKVALMIAMASLVVISFDIQAITANALVNQMLYTEKLSKGKTQINIPVKIQSIAYKNHRLNAAIQIIKSRLIKVLRREM